jgi:hypothetical protein
MLKFPGLISTALRTGTPLPQITPCPLLDRFMLRRYGLNVVHQESEDDYGLLCNLTMDTLQNEQYMSASMSPKCFLVLNADSL